MDWYRNRGLFWALMGLGLLLVQIPEIVLLKVCLWGVFWFFAVSIRVLSRAQIGEHTRLMYLEVPQLETQGMYGWSRNPLYISNLFMVAAWMQFWPLRFALLAFGIGFVFTYLVVRQEEKYLRTTFGDRYETYCATTPRWISFKLPRGVLKNDQSAFFKSFWKDRWTYFWQLAIAIVLIGGVWFF